MTRVLIAMLAFLLLAVQAGPSQAQELLNVSYDPTRELYEALNKAFVAHWKAETGKTLAIKHDG